MGVCVSVCVRGREIERGHTKAKETVARLHKLSKNGSREERKRKEKGKENKKNVKRVY